MFMPLFTHAASSPKTIIVPVDYPTITAAIQHASAGDTINVQSGVYNENPIVDKPLNIIGQNPETTTVIGVGSPNATGITFTVTASVFTVKANNVKISGFTITSPNYGVAIKYPNGVAVEGDNCRVEGNNIVDTFTGVFFSGQIGTVVEHNNITHSFENGIMTYGGYNNTISSNTIVSNTAKDGIAVEGYSYNITGNYIWGTAYGLGLSTTYSVIYKNTITQSNVSAIWLTGSNNIVAANSLSDSRYGVYCVPTYGLCSDNTLYNNNFVNNTENAASNTIYSIQAWDNGSQGNYWSDYAALYPNAKQAGSTGTMNTAYKICDNNLDNYPLMNQYNIQNAGACPAPEAVPQRSGNVAGSWSFQTVSPNGVTPDATGLNPAVFGNEFANVSYVPEQVAGKIGKALYFNGLAFAYVPPSPSIQTPGDLTISAWVYFNEFKNNTYNNIVIEAVTTTDIYPNRTLGFAVNGYSVNGVSNPQIGALRGYVTTDTDGFNEIDTTTQLQLNTWYNVVFTRDTHTGMHIYVDGVEQNVTVFEGVQNPKGSIVPCTVVYLGHDSISTQEQVEILAVAQPPSSSDTGSYLANWVFWLAIAIIAVTITAAFYLRLKAQASPPKRAKINGREKRQLCATCSKLFFHQQQ